MLKALLHLLIDGVEFSIIGRCQLKHEDQKELCSYPEDRAKLDQCDHDQAERCWNIELTRVKPRRITATQHILPWNSIGVERRQTAIGIGHREDK